MANLYAITALLVLLRSTCAVKTAFISSSSSNPSTKSNYNRAATVTVQSRHLKIVSAIDSSSRSSSSSSSLQEASDSHAEAFMSYMAKSHEDKLRAVKDAEDKKNAEIQALRKQIEDVKSGSSIVTTNGSPTSATATSGSIDEIAAKLTAYQNFMSEYIVNAQEDKRKAIQAAEEAISKKYEDKLNAFMLNPVDSKSITIASPTITTVDEQKPTKTLQELKLQKKEVKREIKELKRDIKATSETTLTPDTNAIQPPPTPPPPPLPTTTDPNEHAPPEVIAADHGLRADGGVGGLTLAERVALGSGSPAGPPVNTATTNGTTDPSTPITDAPPPVAVAVAVAVTKDTVVVDPRHRVYFERNVFVADAARARAHNRWGPSEEQLAEDYVNLTLATAVEGAEARVEHAALPPNKLADMDMTARKLPEVEEADHGLRADGGVDGPNLADRVNLGAQILKKK